jgi:hypothetical protein
VLPTPVETARTAYPTVPFTLLFSSLWFSLSISLFYMVFIGRTVVRGSAAALLVAFISPAHTLPLRWIWFYRAASLSHIGCLFARQPPSSRVNWFCILHFTLRLYARFMRCCTHAARTLHARLGIDIGCFSSDYLWTFHRRRLSDVCRLSVLVGSCFFVVAW